MKTRSILMTTLCSLMMGMGFAGCNENDEPEATIGPMEKLTYILNEGLWEANNANISAFISKPGHQVKHVFNIYETNNAGKMGDVANAMIKEDDYIYVVLNGSGYVGKLDLTTKEQARYSLNNPRCIDVEDGYAYVTQHGGKVTKLNVKDMSLVETTPQIGDNLEGIIEKDGKLYVANAWKSVNNFNKEILVIDAKTMDKIDSISVALNPVTVKEIDDKIYVISQGNYYDVPASFQVINTQNNTSKIILNDVSKITEGHNGLIYGVKSITDWSTTPASYAHTFFSYNPKTDKVSETSFLKEVPSTLNTTDIYLLEVDEETGYIYVGTSDYQNSGTIYQFDKNGKFIQSFDSGGVNPSAMIFID